MKKILSIFTLLTLVLFSCENDSDKVFTAEEISAESNSFNTAIR